MATQLQYANADTPSPDRTWLGKSDAERMALVNAMLANGDSAFPELIEILRAQADGQVIVHLKRQLAPGERGTLLLDLEEFLKASIDQGLVVWLEVLGDKNSLRNLRGIEVKG